MRRIQIKLLSIFILISSVCFGQQEQVLRNGFVAATNDGVYYLMDGSNEWVRLGSPSPSVYGGVGRMDTISGVNGYSISNFSYSVIISTNTQQYHWDGVYYGKKLFEDISVGGSYTDGYFTTKNIVEFNRFGKGLISAHMGSWISRYIVVKPGINFNDYQISGSWINNFGSMCLDEDTTLVVVGGNNTLVKIEASRIETNSTITSVELQSQASESHKAVYSPLISKFVIISDLGRVYTYDGSILSYITTIPSCIRILDVSYGNGVIYVVAKYITENDYAVFASSNLTSWVRSSTVGGVQTGIISSAYSKKLNKLLVTYAYVVGSSIAAGANYFYYNGSTVSIYSAPLLYKLPFDLDYINYLP